MATQPSFATKSVITKGGDTKNITVGTTKLEAIIGMPPEPLISKNILFNSIPVASIEPCTAIWADGLNLFRLEKAWPEYVRMLGLSGFVPGSNGSLNVAFSPDNLPSETFTNDYGQTFIAQMANVVSDAAGDISQMSGGRTVGQVTKGLTDWMKQFGGVLGTVGTGLEGATDQVKRMAATMQGSTSPFISRIPGVLDKILAGQKVDFPQVWKNSSYAPTYGITIKLYNINPKSDALMEKLIIGPISAILALALPQAWAETYTYPFFCRVRCPGLFYLPAAGITSVNIIKGGDHGLVGYNKRLGAVDIRIEFQDLFTTLVMQDFAQKGAANDNRTNLKLYVNQMREAAGIYSVYEDLVSGNTTAAVKAIPSNFSPTTPAQTPVDTTTPAADRVNKKEVTMETNLKSKNTALYK